MYVSVCTVQERAREIILITLPFEVSVVVGYQAESLGNLPDVLKPLRGLVFISLIPFHIIQGLSQSWRRYAFRP